MRRFMKGVLAFLPHLIIAISITLLTLSVTDHFNTAMAFINHPMTKALLLIYALLSLAVCGMLMYEMKRGLLKTLPSLICAVVSLALLAVLFYDQLYPREILLTKDFGKTLVFADTVLSMVNAACTAKVRRNAAMRNYREWIKSKQERS